jgi:methionyl-tRNA formyltransferase
MKKFKKIIFFGNERLATGVTTNNLCLERLLSSGYKVSAIVTKKNLVYKIKQLEIVTLAQQKNIRLMTPDKLIDIKNQLKEIDADIGILVAYGKIIPREIINLFPLGIINLHPSLLPEGRGPTPVESAILDGLLKTGVSVMQLDEKMDEGPIFGQEEIDIPPQIQKQELSSSLLDLGSSLLVKLLPGITEGRVVPISQDQSKSTYTKLIKKEDGKIDWTKPAIEIEREIRAYYNWPKSTTSLGGIPVIITSASASMLASAEPQPPGKIQLTKDGMSVGCGQGSLEIYSLIPLNKQEMPMSAFLAGYRSILTS